MPPFSNTPDPRFVYRHRQFDDALGLLARGIEEGKGFLVVTGDVGAGKTTMMRTWLSLFGADYETAVLLNTGLDPDGLLLAICDDLGAAPPASHDRKSLIDAIHEKLLETAARNRSTVLFIDEAQNLSVEALELLRMLSNLETEREKLVQIVLLGQTGLRDLLARPELVQLKSRIAVHRHLRPLDRTETGAYVAHRLKTAGWSDRIRFSEKALRALHEASGGVPRRINILADIACTAARADDVNVVENDYVAGAANEFLDLEPEPDPAVPRPPAPTAAVRWAATGAAWIVLLAVLGIVATRDRPRTDASSPARSAVGLDSDPDRIWEAAADGAVNRQFPLEAASDTFGAGLGMITAAPDIADSDQLLDRESSAEAFPAFAQAADSVGASVAPARDATLPSPSLLPNSRGEAVVKLQNDLFRAGSFHGVVNGFYGPTTMRAVVDFQRSRGLPQTGVFDAPTAASLRSAIGD